MWAICNIKKDQFFKKFATVPHKNATLFKITWVHFQNGGQHSLDNIFCLSGHDVAHLCTGLQYTNNGPTLQ